jgi:CHRD domain
LQDLNIQSYREREEKPDLVYVLVIEPLWPLVRMLPFYHFIFMVMPLLVLVLVDENNSYVNILTKQNPEGEIRGQIFD